MESLEVDLAAITKAIWQWKSNSSPFSKSEKSVWKTYSFEENEQIEDAYHQNKDVMIGDYIVSPKNLLQTRKGNPQAQRPIRRISWMEDEEVFERAERYFETELPKTMNSLFGNLNEFVCFFANRSPEMLSFAKDFEEIETSNDIARLNQRIIPEICACIEKEFEKSSLKKPSESTVASVLKTIHVETEVSDEERILIVPDILKSKMEEKCKALTQLFVKENIQSFQDFYSRILRAYTMGTFLYRNLNGYLRNEEWIELNDLLPYLYCLCKAFFNMNSKPQTENDPSPKKILQTIATNGEKFLTLYRGTRLDESTLSFYDTKKVRYFSWNTVTSATSNLKIARRFINQIGNEIQKYSVLFIINIPLVGEELKYLRYLDVKSCSAVPQEDEVILPPGSTFELQELLKGPNALFNDDEIITITIELQSDFRRLYCRGVFIPGSLLNEIVSNKTLCIRKFSSIQLLDSLKVLFGNLLIQELEFEDCFFDEKSLKQLTKILPTMTKLKRLKFESKSSRIQKEIEHKKKLQMKPINKPKSYKSQEEAHLALDFVMLSNNGNYAALRKWAFIKNLSHLKSFSLNFSRDDLFGNVQIYELCTNGLRFLNHLNSLQLNFSTCWKITDKGIYHLCTEGIKYLTSLNYLQLNFSECYKITNDGIDHIEKSLEDIIHLTDLDLDFSQCFWINQERVYTLCSQGLLHLQALSSVNLVIWWYSLQTLDELESLLLQRLKHFSLSRCVEDPEEEIKILKIGESNLKYSAKKKSLNINFFWESTTDQEIANFKASVLDHLPTFTSLALNFSYCEKITNIGISNLCHQISPHLTGLISLNLDFSHCNMIRNAGISSLCTYASSYLTDLISLDLNFSGCHEITDEGIRFLRGLNNLTALTSLNLNFSQCQQITDCGFSEAIKILKDFIALKSLHLGFSQCPRLTDKAMHSFCFEGLRYLDHLTKLDLNFSECSRINDEGVHFLCVNGLNQLIKLKDLSLNFAGCFEIANAGIRSLAQFGLADISGLTHIDINFSRCFNITEEAFYDLYIERLSHLKASTTLNLYLWWDIYLQLEELDDFFKPKIESLAHSSDQQSSQEIKIISKTGLQCLAYLIYQNFHLPRCDYLPNDENQNNLMEGTSHLTMLKSIALDFSPYWEIAEAGSFHLFIKGICRFTSMTTFNFNFSNCKYISDEKIENLCVQFLSRLSALTCLSLNLSDCKQITNEGVLSLCYQGLKHIVALTTFNLELSNCHKITDQGIFLLCSEGLNHLTRITSLNLKFSSCQGITDEGIQTLALHGLKSLTALTSLNLKFSYFEDITDEGIHTLALNGLEHLTALTSLNLDFSHCERITDKGILNFCSQGLKNLPALKTFCLDFSLWFHPNFDSQYKQAINNLPHLRPLTISWNKRNRIIETKKELMNE